MELLTHEKFKETVCQVLQDFKIPDIEVKLSHGGELHLLLTTMNHVYAYQIWRSNHIHSFLPQHAISSKNLDSFIHSQINHLQAVMTFYNFQYQDKQTYFRLYGTRFALQLFLVNKTFFSNTLHEIAFEYWTNPTSYKTPFEMIRSAFLSLMDLGEIFDEYGSDFSYYKEDFANSFLKMHPFFYAFNITEKRIKTSFAIHVYQELCNLSLSKYKTKEITDTIMHHLDIDTTINLRKIDQVHCIGKIGLHLIYGYDAPIIPLKFLDRPLIHSIQEKKRQEALTLNNHDFIETLDEMIEVFSQSYSV